ncbi:hypothetical protein BCR39DRAFT_533429 [Naematelia encephala]|uniref:SUR7/PalI family-domain-containing protein n=1 Tax=Naematelia encephala TaxID=71784 RepID=A0A1Y2B2M5_9TREE|nr:hypothetical protein BCR39DRAFT_533429 [Naematelia encephala]
MTRRYPASLGLGAFLVLAATLFFWVSAFSVPYIKSLSYLHSDGNGVKYGNFGWCKTDNSLCFKHDGYAWHPEFIGGKHTTGALIFVALTAAFGTLAWLSILHSIYNLSSGFLSAFLTGLTALCATISFFIVVVVFGVAHHRFKHEGLSPHYGGAFPLVIVGWLVYLIALPLIIIGWIRERHYRREIVATEGVTTTEITHKRRWF